MDIGRPNWKLKSPYDACKPALSATKERATVAAFGIEAESFLGGGAEGLDDEDLEDEESDARIDEEEPSRPSPG